MVSWELLKRPVTLMASSNASSVKPPANLIASPTVSGPLAL